MTPVVLHVAPHPDDEVLGAGATLMALRDAGHRVVNLAWGLGRPEDEARRRAELEEACRRAGFELVVRRPVQEVLAAHDVTIVVSPSEHDAHPAHRSVARAVRDALEHAGAGGPAWWTWSLWTDLAAPTLVTLFGHERLDEVLGALAAHRGELERNDYAALVPARATAARVRGAELVFGFGAPGFEAGPYAELLAEARLTPQGWLPGEPRVLDPERPLG